MLYKPRKPQFVSARLFPGESAYPGYNFGVGQNYCNNCRKPLSEHLVSLDGRTMVCPNTYILYEGAQVINMMSKENFESIYEPVYKEEHIDSI